MLKFIIAIIVILGIIKYLLNIHHDYKEDEDEREYEELMRKREEEINQGFLKLMERNRLKGKAAEGNLKSKTSYIYDTPYEQDDDSAYLHSSDYPTNTLHNNQNDEPDMIDLVQEQMATQESVLNEERMREQLEQPTQFGGEDLSWIEEQRIMEDHSSSDFDNHFDDQFERDMDFQDDVLNNDY